MKPRFGIRVPPCDSPKKIADFARQLEDEGWGYVWVPDSQLLWRDLYVTMAFCGSSTSRLSLGTAVTNPLTRDASVTACAMATVDEIANGRTILGLGAGDSSVTTIGFRPATVATCRKYIQTVKAYFRGELVRHGDVAAKMNIAHRNIPVYLSSIGPRMLQLAGELCDGAITLLGVTDESVDYARQHIAAGARISQRDPDQLDYVWGAFCYFTDDVDKAVELLRPFCLSHLQRYPALFKVNREPVDGFKAPEGVYPDLGHAEDWKKASQIAGESLDRQTVLDFAEKFCLVGRPVDVIEKIERLRKRGINSFYLRHLFSYELPETEVKVFSEEIIPNLS